MVVLNDRLGARVLERMLELDAGLLVFDRQLLQLTRQIVRQSRRPRVLAHRGRVRPAEFFECGAVALVLVGGRGANVRERLLEIGLRSRTRRFGLAQLRLDPGVDRFELSQAGFRGVTRGFDVAQSRAGVRVGKLEFLQPRLGGRPRRLHVAQARFGGRARLVDFVEP